MAPFHIEKNKRFWSFWAILTKNHLIKPIWRAELIYEAIFMIYVTGHTPLYQCPGENPPQWTPVEKRPLKMLPGGPGKLLILILASVKINSELIEC